MHQAVVRQLFNERLGTHATKTRGMVRGGGCKPETKRYWCARSVPGRSQSGWWRYHLVHNLFQHCKAMPRKARRLAVKSLSDKVNNSELYVLEENHISSS